MKESKYKVAKEKIWTGFHGGKPPKDYSGTYTPQAGYGLKKVKGKSKKSSDK